MHVLLIRNREQDTPPTTLEPPKDKYKATLVAYPSVASVHFVAPLDDTLLPPSATQLRQWIAGGDNLGYDALIVTSKRALVALEGAIRDAPDSDTSCHTQCFVVGPATAEYARNSPLLSTWLDPLGGDECGCAQELAPFIERYYATRMDGGLSLRREVKDGHHQSLRHLLLLCGDKRRDTIPEYFASSATVRVDEYRCYETRARPLVVLREELACVARQLADDRSDQPIVIAFFSPSGVDAIWDTLQEVFKQQQLLCRCRYAAIGATTGDRLAAVVPTQHVAVAERPTPEALASCIINRFNNVQ